MNKDFLLACQEQTNYTVATSRASVDLFCRILGYPANDLNHLIGDDPHGIVDMQEGYRYFNMTDIHVLIADYARWLAIYKDNRTIRKVVDEWYYWKTGKATLPCNLKNWLMGWRPKPEDCLPYYKEHQAQEQAAAQKRVEQAKADLNEAADEFNENKLYKV